MEFYRHNIEHSDISKAAEVLQSIFLTTGQVVAEFEETFAAFTGLRHAVAVTSCTAALHLSLLANGIGQGDEVITTPMSFCATANAILHAGATPVFVDVEMETGNIDAARIERAVTGRTKAIIPVHLYGQMCDMKNIRELADRHGLKIIEDAAHAIEAERNGFRVGQAADTSCYSFYATKNITSGEGGAICTDNLEMAETLRMLRSHGIDRSAADRYTKQYRHWDMPMLGWKYNMDNIHAALLVGQTKRLDTLWLRREALWHRYEEKLQGVAGVEILRTVEGSKHARHLFTILVNPARRDEILWELQERGIGVAVNYRPIHLLSYYRKFFGYKEGDFPVAEDIGSRTLSLPLYPKLREIELQHVVESLLEIVNG